MQTLKLVQGTNDWIAARARHFCASEASAMLGLSSKTKRNELLRMKKTGETKEFSEWVQKNLLDKGHEVEAKARPIVEAIVGEDLYPVTGSCEIGGMKLLASFDGITMGGEDGWENKSRNKEFVDAVRAGVVPDEIWPQLEHQAIVGDLNRIYWSVSDGTEEGTMGMWYVPQPERRSKIISGWAQFNLDLEAHEVTEEVPAPIAMPVRDLPAVIYKMEGLKLTSNLPEFKTAALQLVEDSRKELTTDQHFADQEALNKAFKKAEANIELVKAQAIGEITDVDKFCRDMSEIGALIKQARITGENRVETRKAAIKNEILQRGRDAVAEHISALNKRLGRQYMPAIANDFAGAIKGKRNLDSMNDAVDTEIARFKIEANSVADKIQLNLTYLRENAADHTFLFQDTATIVLKANDDLIALATTRISAYKEQERVKAEAAEKARVEELARVEKARLEEVARVAASAEAARQRQLAEPIPVPPLVAAPAAAVAPAAAPPPAPIPSLATSFLQPLATVLNSAVTQLPAGDIVQAINTRLSEMDAHEQLDVLNHCIAVITRRTKAA